jgi:hypothetical protein
LTSFIALDRAGVFFDQRLPQQIPHGPADVGRVLGDGFSDTGAREAGRDHVAVGPLVVGEEVKQDAVSGGDVHLGDVTRHASRCRF